MSNQTKPLFEDAAAPFRIMAKTSGGTSVDFRRAAALMEPDLLRQAVARFGQPAPWPDDPCVPSDYLSRVWGYYCHLHFRHVGQPFTPDSLPRWHEPSLKLGLLDMDAGVLMPLQFACSGECLFAHRSGLVRGAANDR